LDDTNLPDSAANKHVCFSPDSKKLYISASPSLWQFDLSSGVPSTVAASGEVVATYSHYGYGGFEMQIGLDSAIYVTRGIGTPWNGHSSHYLSVIPNPNAPAANVIVAKDSIYTGQR